LTVYLVVLFDLTLLRFSMDRPAANLTPFHTIAHDWRAGGHEFVINLLGNLAAFVPLGVLLPSAWPGRVPLSAWRAVATGAGLSLAIELAQYASGRRVADVDDVLLNAAGTLLGYGALRAARALGTRHLAEGG
jgi:glycopeptide antibiotics resistance protein